MTISSGYSIDLYCECQQCKASHSHQEHKGGRGRYAGECWSDCKRQAVKDGWRIQQDRQTCYAPGHYKRRRNSAPPR